MQTAKQEVQKILKNIPDTATLEDIQYHIYVLEKIGKGFKDVKESRVLSQEEVEQRMSQWIAK